MRPISPGLQAIKTSVERLSVGRREIRDVLAIIESTRKQIVEKR